MKPYVLLALALLLTASSGTSQKVEADKEPGSDPVEGPSALDNDATIYEFEVAAPAIDSQDDGWKPLYAWFEDPASLRCDGRKDCEDYKAAEVAKTDESTQDGGR